MAKLAQFYDFKKLVSNDAFMALVRQVFRDVMSHPDELELWCVVNGLDVSCVGLDAIKAERKRDKIADLTSKVTPFWEPDENIFERVNELARVFDDEDVLVRLLSDFDASLPRVFSNVRGRDIFIDSVRQFLRDELDGDSDGRVSKNIMEQKVDVVFKYAVAAAVGVGLLALGYRFVKIHREDGLYFEPSEEARRAMTRWLIVARDGEHELELDDPERVRAFLRGVRLFDVLEGGVDVAPYVEEVAEAEHPGVVIAVKLRAPELIEQLETRGLGMSTIRALTAAIVGGDAQEVRLSRVDMQALSALELNVIG